MHRTIKLKYLAADPDFQNVLLGQRRRQSRAIRTAYCRLADGLPAKQLYQNLRASPVGQGLHTWLLLSGMTKAKTLYKLRPEGGIVFGGRKRLIARSQGKMSAEEWQAHRLSPLIIEGHARSFGRQGGNHLVTLDAENRRLIFHGPNGADFVLQLKLSGRSRPYRKRLEELQARCETLRDTPFSVSLSDTEVSISWSAPAHVTTPSARSQRILSLDLNPSRIGWTVVEQADANRVRSVAWGVFEYPHLTRRLKVASDHPDAVALNNKRQHELSVLAKSIAQKAHHYGAGTIVTERLQLGAKDHGQGRHFNRLVNQCWMPQGFLQPLLRRLEEIGLNHAQVNPAYSSLIGNFLWADALQIPDPACAALEIGRRYLNPLPFVPDTLNRPPMSNADRQWKDGLRAAEQSAALGAWGRVWKNLNPRARDTPRRTRRPWHGSFPSGFPRQPSVREQRSQVLHFDPQLGTSESFGFDFSLLLAG